MDTSTWSFDAIIHRLAHHPRVGAILQVDSAAEGRFSAASDYDLVIVLNGAPQPWFVGITTIDDRLSDLIFVATSAVIGLSQLRTAVAPDDPLAPIIRWIRSEVLRFDRSGTVRTIQQRLQQGEWILPVSDEEAFQAWFALHYNLAQTKWMSQAQGSLYRDTVQIRIAVYGPADIWFGYFRMRKIPWRGDKAAIQHLRHHDHAFLKRYQQFIQENNLEQKLQLYEQVGAQAASPLGGLWPDNATFMNIESAKNLWELLMMENQ